MSMLEGWIAALKGDKKLSFNHWRYRLLHWTFNVEAESPIQSELPRCLYTHYCPLFHLTNLLVFAAPFVALFRLIYLFFVTIAPYVGAGLYVVGKAIEFIVSMIPERKAAPAPAPVEEEPTEEMLEVMKRIEIASIPRLILKVGVGADFDDFWTMCYSKFKVLKTGEVEVHWTRFREEIIAAQETAKQRKKKFQEAMIFWIGFSRIFIKFLMWAFYGALALGVGYITLFWILPLAIWLVYFMLTIDWLFVSWILLKVLVSVSLFAGAVYLLFRSMRSETVRKYVTPPFSLVAEIAGVVVLTIAKAVAGAVEFVQMFYENNCPAITIVDEAQATIASVEEN